MNLFSSRAACSNAIDFKPCPPQLVVSTMKLLALLLLASTCLCSGVVTKPVDDISDIRLSSSKEQVTGQRATRRLVQATEPVQMPTEGLSVKLNITEPPQGAILGGGSFVVKIEIIASDEDEFLKSYNTTDGKMCVGLYTNGPYHCWPALSGRIFFTGVEATEEMEFTLEAMLYRAGELDHSTKATSTFTVVPKLAAKKSSKNDEISVIDQNNHNQMEEPPTTQVQVEFPRVEVSKPFDLVTYPGHSVPLRFGLKTNEAFLQYFANAFICTNIDRAPASPCFAIFGNEDYASPLVLNLPNGKHTIEAALSHPETGELLPGSMSSTSTFFTAGELLEAANVAVDVTVAGERHVVPLMEGTNLEAQTNAFCDSVGMVENKACEERVKHKLWSAWENMLQG